MPPGALVAGTPYYVLLDGNRRLGPHMAPSDSGIDCAPIYGFTAAGAYHEFRQNSEQLLTPYPLVKVYLRLQASAAGADPKLVVIDATGPREARLQAATMEDVLKAQENKAAQVTTGYQLVFDQETSAYRVETTAV